MSVFQSTMMGEQLRGSSLARQTSPLPCCRRSRQARALRRQSKLTPVQAGFGDFFKDIFDFESWAPRSSQAWRLGQQPSPRRGAAEETITEDDVEVLNQRLASSKKAAGSSPLSDMIDDENSGRGLGGAPEMTSSFLRSTDEEFADALNARITEVASSSAALASWDAQDGRAGGEDEEEEGDVQHLSGSTLSDLIYEKYGKRHDVSFVRRDIPGKTLVSFNIYHAHVGQRSFPMTEESFAEKMDGIALYLEAWGQTERVVTFLKEPVAPRRGLPSRPIVGNAVSVQLDLTREQVSEWFGR